MPADNFPVPYLLNDAALKVGIPVVHGSIFRFEGQVAVFKPHDGPCYRCFLPEPPPAELAPSCAEAGVQGVLPGIVGSIQAVEAIKLILGVGEDLSGLLLAYDSLEESFRTYRMLRDPECPTCEYDELCMPHPILPPPGAADWSGGLGGVTAGEDEAVHEDRTPGRALLGPIGDGHHGVISLFRCRNGRPDV